MHPNVMFILVLVWILIDTILLVSLARAFTFQTTLKDEADSLDSFDHQVLIDPAERQSYGVFEFDTVISGDLENASRCDDHLSFVLTPLRKVDCVDFIRQCQPQEVASYDLPIGLWQPGTQRVEVVLDCRHQSLVSCSIRWL